MTTCNRCGAPITWVESPYLRRYQVDADPVDDGGLVLTHSNGLPPMAFPATDSDEGPRYRRHQCGGEA